MLDWIDGREQLYGWAFGLSLAMFLVTLAAAPWMIARIPVDYFARRPPLLPCEGRPLALRCAVFVVKNLLGVALIAVGLAMLVLPGQGLLTILVGSMLTSFPGKRALEVAFVRHTPVLRAMNWFRERVGAPPLRLDGRDESA